MTPTEQDKELRELVHIVQNADTTYDAMQFIKADRKRVALEARLDELKRFDRSSEEMTKLIPLKIGERLYELTKQEEQDNE